MSLKVNVTATKNDKMIAFCRVLINDTISVGGIKVWDNDDGLNVQMPGDSSNRRFYQNFKFTNKQHQEDFETEIIKAVREKLKLKEPEAKSEEEQKATEPAF